MPDWLVNLIVGIFSALLGFIGGFFAKTQQIKIKQKSKGNKNIQYIGEVKNGK